MVKYSSKQLAGLGLKVTGDGKVSIMDRQNRIDSFSTVYSEERGFFIPHEVMSSKRGKELFTYKKEGRVVPGMTDSKQVKQYRKDAGSYYEILSVPFREIAMYKMRPFYIEFTFVRRTEADWDFHNMVQLVCDMMVEYGWLHDDCVKEMVPVPPPKGKPVYLVDSTAPGVWVRIT